MTRTFAIFLCALATVLFAVGCGETTETADETADTTESAVVTTETPPDATETMEEVPVTIEFKNIDDLMTLFPFEDFDHGIKYYDIKEGTGAEVQSGDYITAHYTLWNSKGEMLQTSVGGDPFQVNIGVGQLIKGWDLTVPGMKVGGSRLLVVPGDMAYGESPRPGSGIGLNETLVFKLEILDTESN